MALPSDFSKIFGSTATGGLTPISDVNYAKGWESVGANPPTKNDFSYLQNLSDLKAQWLYNYISSSSNAASRTVGTGVNQIPDMNSFARVFSGNGYQKLPGGLIIQWGGVTTSASSDVVVLFPIAFPSASPSITLTPDVTPGSGSFSTSNTVGPTGFNVAAWTAPTTRTAVLCRWLAVGY